MLYLLQCGWLGIIDTFYSVYSIFACTFGHKFKYRNQNSRSTLTFYYSKFYYFSSFYVDLMNRGTLDTLSCMIDYIFKKKESIKRKI